jgi:hypothetical protein
MGIEAIGATSIDMEKARTRFARRRPGIVFLGWGGRGAAINDVSIADSMHPSSHDWKIRYEPRGLLPEEGPTIIRSLREIWAGG